MLTSQSFTHRRLFLMVTTFVSILLVLAIAYWFYRKAQAA